MSTHPKFGFPMKTYWDSWETPYQMGAQKHRTYLLDLLKEKGVESLLDVGCGTGPIFGLICNSEEGRWDNIKKYKGVDYSEAMIRIAVEQFPWGNWEVQDARKLKEEDDSYDCVLLMHCLDHLDDYKAAIAEAKRVSKDYICIVFWRPFSTTDNLNDRNMMGKKEGEEPWEDTHLHEYNRLEMEDCFRENDLSILHVIEGQAINSDYSKYNFLYFLRVNKEEVKL